MNVAAEDLLKPLTLKLSPSISDYRMAEWHLQAADAFARIIRQSVYIIDYYQKGFLYVSDNPLFLCGEKSKNVLKLGFEFYKKKVPASDLELMQQINEAGLNFYYKLPASDKLNYTVSFDYNLEQPTGQFVLVNQKVTPLVLDKYDNIWLALCLVTHSSNKKAGNVFITKKGSNKTFEYDPALKEWVARKRIKLTRQEICILTLAAQGFTIDQIAREIVISEATVKFHKRNIFKKLHVKNIAEAISFAINNNLF
jgi:DNA-binding CsgD family transcriptional regulator